MEGGVGVLLHGVGAFAVGVVEERGGEGKGLGGVEREPEGGGGGRKGIGGEE